MKPQNFNPTEKQMERIVTAYIYGFKMLQYVPDYLADDGYLHFTGANGHGIIHLNKDGIFLSNKVLDLCRMPVEKLIVNSQIINN